MTKLETKLESEFLDIIIKSSQQECEHRISNIHILRFILYKDEIEVYIINELTNSSNGYVALLEVSFGEEREKVKSIFTFAYNTRKKRNVTYGGPSMFCRKIVDILGGTPEKFELFLQELRIGLL